MNEINEKMANLIKKWGLPNWLKENEDNIVFKFEGRGFLNPPESEYRCKDGDVKFFLFDQRLEKTLFSMEFFKIGSTIPINGIENDKRKRMRLELLYVHDKNHRKKGISDYYIKKLINYSILENLACINVNVNTNAKIFRNINRDNTLIQQELKKYYEKRSSPEMPILVV